MEPVDHDPTSGDTGDQFVGAPTEFADAQEVPEWVANIAKLIFFLPSAWVTATTIPIVAIGCSLLFLVLMCVGLSLLISSL